MVLVCRFETISFKIFHIGLKVLVYKNDRSQFVSLFKNCLFNGSKPKIPQTYNQSTQSISWPIRFYKQKWQVYRQHKHFKVKLKQSLICKVHNRTQRTVTSSMYTVELGNSKYPHQNSFHLPCSIQTSNITWRHRRTLRMTSHLLDSWCRRCSQIQNSFDGGK